MCIKNDRSSKMYSDEVSDRSVDIAKPPSFFKKMVGIPILD